MKATRSLRWVALTVVLLALPPIAAATDLKKVDRSIVKEPAYVTKQPRYCLLVFGPQATTRVWLVADGDFLYVDRNGNGDLTDPGERVRFSGLREGQGTLAGTREADAGDIFEGKLKHERLTVTQSRVGKGFVPKDCSEEELLALANKGGETLVYNLSISLKIRP